MNGPWDTATLRLFRRMLAYYALAAVFVALGQAYLERRQLAGSVLEEIPRVAGYFLPALGNALWNLDVEQAQAVARGVTQNRYVAQVLVKDHSGDIAFAVTMDRQMGQMDVERGMGSRALEGRRLTYPIPPPEGRRGAALGAMVVVVDEAAINQEVWRGLFLILLNTAILALVLGGLLMFFGSAYLVRPIRALSAAVGRINLETLGNDRLSVDTAGNRELEVLQATFNDLVERLAQAILRETEAQKEFREATVAAEVMAAAKEMAEKSSEMLGTILDNSPVPTFVIGPDHCITHWNNACEKVLGASRGEMIGTTDSWRVAHHHPQPVLADLVMEGDAEKIARHLDGKCGPSRAVDGGYEGEGFFPKLGRWIYFTAAPLKDRGGKVVGAIETLQDISERKRAEQALSAELAFSKALLNAQSDCGIGLAIIDQERIIFANEGLAVIYGATVGHLQRMGNFIQLFAPEERERIRANHERRLAGEIFGNRYDTRIIRHDGVCREVELAVSTILRGDRRQVMVVMIDITTRKLAEEKRRLSEEALRLSEEKYRQVIENVSEGIALVQNRRFVFVNPRACQITGYSQEQLIGREFPGIIFEEDRGKVIERHSRRLAGESVEPRYDFRVLHRDGRTTWVELGAVLIQWEGEVATLCFFTDISARKQLEENLRRTLIERETILENSIVGIIFLDARGRVRWANQGMAEMFQTTVKSQLGASLEKYYPSREHYLHTGAEVSARVRQGKTYEAELQMRRADGELFWVYLSGKGVHVNDLTQGTVWVLVDITRRKELEDQLQRTSSEREAILQSALVGITFSVNRCHQWVNPAFAEMMGYTQEEMIGQCSSLHFPDEESWRNFGEDAYAVISRGDHFSRECRMRRRDGSLFWVEVSGSAVESIHPERGTIWTFLDITERKQAEEDVRLALEQQKELNLLKSRFVSMTSHEFRTPLTTILSSTELLRHYADRLPEGEKAELFDSVEGSVAHMTEMLDKILVIGKADADLLGFSPLPLDLETICRSLADEASASVRQYGNALPELVLTFSGDGSQPCLDQKLLRHILGNLLSNALKYSPQGGQVDFQVTLADGLVKFVVADQGIGIPEEDLPKLFESFHRAGNVGNIQGTGLGMAIVKKSTDAHGGSICVTSKVGQGTRFIVTLPAPSAAEGE